MKKSSRKNDIIPVDEFVGRIYRDIKLAGKKYQQDTGCSKEERNKFEVSVLVGSFGGLMSGDMPK